MACRTTVIRLAPSFFVAHVYYWGDRHRDIFLGLERAARISPLNTALEKEIPFTIHLDTPVVPMDPLLLAWTAVNRQTADGEILGPAERIPVMAAPTAAPTKPSSQIGVSKTRSPGMLNLKRKG